MKFEALFALLLPSVAYSAGLEGRLGEHWHDGRAELSGYRLTQPRYGQLRSGRAVLVYVTEPFSESDRVKMESGRHPPSDEFPVMKLNLVKDFQTGVYDYNVMTSIFASMAPRYGREAGALTKLTFSAQEWCGQVFEELLFDEDELRHRSFSYFDGEGDQDRQVDHPIGGIAFERLFFAVRGIPEPLLAPGETRELPIYDRIERSRLLHRPARWRGGRVHRRADRERVTVPAGTFEVDVYEATVTGENYRFDVESAFPHRLVRWSGPDGEEAELMGSERMKYWQQSDEGDEARLREFGLSPRPLLP